MKKAYTSTSIFLFILLMMLPVGVTLTAYYGYTFELANDAVFAVITAFSAIGTVVLSEKSKDSAENTRVTVLLALTAPLSLINTVFCLLEAMSVWVVISMAVCVGCCFYLSLRFGKPMVLKIFSWLLTGLMLLPVGFLWFIALVFGSIGQNTVVQSAASPDGTYYAEVIDSDQGALGGDTLVDVYENGGINAFLFKITKAPQRVYHGDWGEFEDMEVYWKSDDCLVINSVEYRIASQTADNTLPAPPSE